MDQSLITARLLTQRAALPREGGGLEVGPAAIDLAGPRIARVTLGTAPPPSLPPGVPVEDLGARFVTPAFIDGHTHVALSALRGLTPTEDAEHNLVEAVFYRFESRIGPDDVRAFARMGAYEALLSGTALIWDHYYHGPALAEAFSDVGIGAVIASTLQDLGGPGAKRSREALRETEAIAGSAEFKEQGIFAALGPHATDTVSPALFREAGERARDLNLPVHCHLAQSLDELERAFARHGAGPVEILRRSGVLELAPKSLWVHGILLSDDALKALDPSRHTLAFCPHSTQIFAFPPDIPAWDRAGIPWIVATDCAASNDAVDVQRDLRAVAGLPTAALTEGPAFKAFMKDGRPEAAQAVWRARSEARGRMAHLLDPAALLEKVWSLPGGLHPQFEAGALKAGALANLTVWDLDHPAFWPGEDPLRALAYSKVSPAIHNMMAAGRWVGQHGDYHRSIHQSDAYGHAREEASRRLKALLG